jgi:hypothetical protein
LDGACAAFCAKQEFGPQAIAARATIAKTVETDLPCEGKWAMGKPPEIGSTQHKPKSEFLPLE